VEVTLTGLVKKILAIGIEKVAQDEGVIER
jgi:hypothetical protein